MYSINIAFSWQVQSLLFLRSNASMPRRRLPVETLDLAALPVTKTIGPVQHGALKHRQRHGASLVCVRHRVEPRTSTRYVTVELVVDQLPIARKDDPEVLVALSPFERSALRARLLAYGAQWDAIRRLWRMPRSVARSLRLLKNVVHDSFSESR